MPEKMLRSLKKALQRADTVCKRCCVDRKPVRTRPVQLAPTPVQPVSVRGISSFSWLKPAELKFNSEVQLVSSN